MKAIISTTYDDKYLWYLPLTVWAWNKLGVDVICFFPANNDDTDIMLHHVNNTMNDLGMRFDLLPFNAPKHKEATYAQCSRLYGACLDLPENEVLITSDVDMAVFKIPTYGGTGMGVVGLDLVPPNQIPICYIYGDVKEWRRVFKLQYGALSQNEGALATIETKTYQQCLDDLLGNVESITMRGDYWGKDQEEAYSKILGGYGQSATLMPRSNGQNQFATKRYDRDDAYILDRLSPDTIDFHMNRPGYEEKNFEIILTILKYHYPDEDFTWLINYTNQYKALL